MAPFTLPSSTPTADADADPSVHASMSRAIAASLGPRRFEMWFERTARFAFDDGNDTLRVAVPNRFIADRITRHYADAVETAAREALGLDAADPLRLAVHLEPDAFGQAPGPVPAPACPPDDAPASRATPPARSAHRRITADPALAGRLRHRLDDFVVGPSNELAYNAAHQLATADDGAKPPLLFLHGACGLGKTHLLQGICRRFTELRPDAAVLYTTGEQFTNRYITAVRTRQLDAFRRAMRSLDLLAVDDVHFFRNKTGTQQEFLHSFDHIELGGSRVVLASDAHPKQIGQFSEALVSRLVQGLVVQVTPPDEATRRRIIAALAQRRGLLLDAAGADAVAAAAGRSVREIEGCLAKLHALASLNQPGGGHRLVGRAALDQLRHAQAAATPRQPLGFDALCDAACRALHVTRHQISGSSRRRNVVIARGVLVHATRQLTGMSYPEIASALGKSSHSTAITADQRMQRQLDADEPMLLPGRAATVTPRQLLDEVKADALATVA